ncbi:NrfD/PsrC family molybdoenzyme membrane anchor subunit, partial [Klebsiella aerogenes]|nr:NrfD/PsrC family molybdoenzyme membrane anchor subunit [Klebsiella aerogenes]
VQYFFFIGIACCATLYACWQCWKGRTGNPRLEAVAVFIAVTAGITAPLALTADLHQTARVWHFYAYPTPWSWMAWGSLL